MSKRVVVVGAGAIGGYTGGHLVRNGMDVTFIDAWPEHVEHIRRHGLQLSGLTPEEACVVKARALHVADVQQLVRERPVDVAFICVKSYDTEWAAHLIKPYLAPDGFAVSLQNCINEERLAAILGWGRVMGCIASLIAVELYAPGRVKRTVPIGGKAHTVYRVGEPHGRTTARAETVAQMLAAVDSAKVTSNLWGERWSKLVINSMRNGVSAFTGMSGNARDADDHVRDLTVRLGSQAVRVGQALGFDLEKMLGMEPEVLARAGEGNADAKAEIDRILLGLGSRRSDEQRPSMAQDIFKGRRTETDYINGFVAQRGREIGVDAGTHAAVNELVRKVERGLIKPGIEHAAKL